MNAGSDAYPSDSVRRRRGGDVAPAVSPRRFRASLGNETLSFVQRVLANMGDYVAMLRAGRDPARPRPEKIIEVAGHRGVRYDDVVAAMDIAKSAGVAVITVAPKGPAQNP